MDMKIKQFKNEQEAIEEIMVKFCDGENPVLDDEDAKALAPKIVEKIPPAMRADYDENVVIAAAQYADTYREIMNKNSNNGGTGIAVQSQGEVASNFDKHAMPKVSDSEQKVIQSIISQMDKDERRKNTMNTKLTKYLYKNQPLALLLGVDSVKVHPEINAKTLDKIEKNLVRDEANEAEWERIKALCADPASTVDAPLNSKLGRPEGVIIRTEGAGEGSNKSSEKILSREELISYLFLNTMLKIGSDAKTGLGAKIGKVEKKQVKSANGTAKEKASISVVFTGQRDIDPANYDFINEPVTKADGKTLETKSRAISTNLTVKVWVERQNNSTGVKEKVPGTQRIRGKYECPIFTRKAEYEATFGKTENKDFIDPNISEEDIRVAEEKTQFLLSLVATNQVGDVSKYGDAMKSIVEQLKEAQNQAVDTENIGF